LRLLLDTHILLWWLADEGRIPEKHREIIRDGRTQVFVSAASTWEVVIKQRLGKLRAPADLKAQVEAARFELLNITIDHALAVGELPDHHSDPFDRMLIAQARTESLILVTEDPKLRLYDLPILGR
jgi:PIN domain nuclease of toxin-antitoxin system